MEAFLHQVLSGLATGGIYAIVALALVMIYQATHLVNFAQAFLGSAAGPWVDDPGTSLVAVPLAGQVKGVDGPDWVLACVLFEVTATVVTQARTAFGHCEQMAWDGDRWVIADGAYPAPAPSTWPGTELAAAAGWRTWVAAGE